MTYEIVEQLSKVILRLFGFMANNIILSINKSTTYTTLLLNTCMSSKKLIITGLILF